MDQTFLHLRRLGLAEYEARVYGALLTHSPASATYVAKKCNLSRSSVYTTLSSLIAKGLVGTTYKNDVKQFIVEDLAALETMLARERSALEAKHQHIDSLKALLHATMRSDTQTPQIVFFEGQEGLKKIYLSMMRNAPQGAVRYLLRDEFLWQPEWEFTFKQEWSSTLKRWGSEKNMHTKLLVNSSKLEKSKATFYKSQKAFEFRYLPSENAVHNFAQYVIGDTIAILSTEENNLVGIQITNKHLADNFKRNFETLWKGSSAR